MPGVGTLIDMSGIIAGGATALAFGRLFSDRMKNMILCLGINLIWNKEIRVANMLPMIVIGAVLSYVPGL